MKEKGGGERNIIMCLECKRELCLGNPCSLERFRNYHMVGGGGMFENIDHVSCTAKKKRGRV